MDLRAAFDSGSRFSAFVDQLTEVIGRAGRERRFRDYCIGLLGAPGRKSVEPMAVVTAPSQVAAQHQKLLHFVANAPWSDEPVLAKVRELVLPSIERHGPIEVWIIDDTSFPKHGTHSVGVHHQYCGQLGKQANCQVVVTLSIANHYASLPLAYRLYLPETWADDAARRKQAHVPREIRFRTKPEIALEQLRAACAAGVPRGVVLLDAGYGVSNELRAGITALALPYIAAITAPIKIRPVGKDGALGTRSSAKDLAIRLPKSSWRTITWREGSAEKLRSRFAQVRVRVAPIRRASKQPEETLLIEWPKDEPEPTKYWLSTLPADTSLQCLVDTAKMRWRIERDYQDLKQEIGLGHYEGRGWVGFHHHGTLCIAAYGFLISERETIPPSGPRPSRIGSKITLPNGYRPRGAPDQTRTACSGLDQQHALHAARRDRSPPTQMSVLRADVRVTRKMTQ
jgi:SRSO17 transposase